jgi:hypothetical protein
MDPPTAPDQPPDSPSAPPKAETGSGALEEDRNSGGDRAPEDDDYEAVHVSSDTGDKRQEHNSDDAVPNGGPSKPGLGRTFEQFLQQKQKGAIQIDEAKADLLPAKLRSPIKNVIAKINRWSLRNPTGPALIALRDLADRLNDFFDLQARRDDYDYEPRCRDLLRMIYQDTIETQKMTRRLKDAAIPRALAEYD